MPEEITIGNARLIHGDCREILPALPECDLILTDPLSTRVFYPHVTRLAEAYEVAENIGLCRSVEQPEWADVMNWNRATNYTTALLACSSISLYGKRTGLYPSLAAIGGYSANVIWGIRTAFMQRLECAVALLAAKPFPAFGFVLSREPRLYFKTIAAMRAFVLLANHKVDCSSLLTRKRIGWPKSLSPLISYFVSVWHRSVCHVPLSAAHLTAKPCRSIPIWLHLKSGSAYFACFRNHTRIIPLFMGSGTTGVACANLGKAFTGIERERKYFDIACERITRAYAQERLFA